MERHGAAGSGLAGQGKVYFLTRSMVMSDSTPDIDERPQFQKHPDTSLIERLLRTVKVGELITYDQLSEQLGRDYRKFCLSHGQSARRSLEKAGVYFLAVPNEGYRRLSESEKITITGRSRLRNARSQTRKGLAVIGRTNLSELDDATRREALTTVSQLQAVQLFASGKSAKKIESKLQDSNMTLALGQTIAMFQSES